MKIAPTDRTSSVSREKERVDVCRSSAVAVRLDGDLVASTHVNCQCCAVLLRVFCVSDSGASRRCHTKRSMSDTELTAEIMQLIAAARTAAVADAAPPDKAPPPRPIDKAQPSVVHIEVGSGCF